MNVKHSMKFFGFLCGLLFLSQADAAGLSISNTPLYVTQPLAPNVIISPVYTTEYNEVSLRNEPGTKINAACNAQDIEQPCTSSHPSNMPSLWQVGAPFYLFNMSALGWRVTPWPNVRVRNDAGAHLSSDVALYPNDTIEWGGVSEFKPLDDRPGSDQYVTEDQYPGSASLNPVAAGKVRYSRSNLNFLYFNKQVADTIGYSRWPALGTWDTFPIYDTSTSSTPYYHPLVHHDLLGIADLTNSNGAYLSLICSASNLLDSCSTQSTATVYPFIGQYWTYTSGDVWKSSSYSQTTWTDMSPNDKVNFAHWFTYWRSSDLAARGMMGRLVDTLGKNKKDLLGKLRLGIFHADKNGNKFVNVNVEARDTETQLVQTLADMIYSQNSVFTTVSPDSAYVGQGDKGYTASIWDPYFTMDYFKTEEPYRDDPGNATSTANPLRSCRRNYEIVLTPDYSGLRINTRELTVPRSNNTYSGNYDSALGAPYSDNYADTLGDVGAVGWNTDLRDDLDNNLLPSKYDSQKAQHLVRYVIGPSDLGIVFNRPMVSYDDALNFLKDHPADNSKNSGWSDADTEVRIGPAAIDELWHMALNSRGFFYGGENVSDALDKLLQSLNDILVNNVSGSSVATSTTSLSAGGLIYLATVESDWKGHLRAYTITPDTSNPNKPIFTIDYTAHVWDLAEKVSALSWDARNIATYNGSTGVPFLWGNIGTNTQDYLKVDKPGDMTNATDIATYGKNKLEYLRGSGACEDGAASSCTYVGAASATRSYVFRRRNLERNNTTVYSSANVGGRNLLGDIANSNPWLVSPPVAGPSDVDFPGYNEFRVGKKSRPNVLYVGANDGMLHAVKANDSKDANGYVIEPADGGKEYFAYVPSFVQDNLHELAKTSYGHNYYVDGSPFSAEVNVGGWKTVLAGGANRGGKGYYLLDVTDPANNTEANAATWVLWEFTEPDLHYTFNLPVAFQKGNLREGQARQIARMNDGNWALIVGNGYPEEADKRACLYIINLSGPGDDHIWGTPADVAVGSDYHSSEYHKLCAGEVNYSADHGLGTNGLSTPTPYDSNGDGRVDIIYAGDLNGNMWKFDVSATSATTQVENLDTHVVTTTNNWTVANSREPLFIAKNLAGKRQPIISPAEVKPYSVGSIPGQLVLFGTGKYIELDDRINVDTQSFYGVWDRGLSGILRGSLFEQSSFDPVTENAVTIRIQTSKLAFAYCGTGDATACASEDPRKYLGWYWDMPTSGERLTGNVSLINSIVLFNTFFPLTDTYVDAAGHTQTRLDANGNAMLDPCKYGGDGWFMGLNAEYGYMEDQFSVFDVNQDGVVDSTDTEAAGVKVGAAIGGTSFARGFGDTVIGLYSPTNKEQSGKNSSSVIDTGGGSEKGRVSWFELLD